MGDSDNPSLPTDDVVPLRYRTGEDGQDGQDELSFISLTTILGTPMDVTVEELAIESFYPADERTARALATRGSHQP